MTAGPDTSSSLPLHGPVSILSFDLEDWSYLVMRMFGREPVGHPREVVRQTERVLELLSRHSVRATFFVLGSTAASVPELVRMLAAEGHEIATHGYAHRPVDKGGLAELAEDVRRAKGELEKLAGQAVRGYRAAAFSVPVGDWRGFFETLAGEGIEYDSSVVPVAMPRYGIGGFGLGPRRVVTAGGRVVLEFPLSVVRWAGRARMVAGGGYWRLLPGFALRRAIRAVHRDGRPLVTYFHNYEFDDRPLWPAAMGRGCWAVRKWAMRSNLFRRSIPGKLESALREFAFVPFRDVLDRYRDAPCPDGAGGEWERR